MSETSRPLPNSPLFCVVARIEFLPFETFNDYKDRLKNQLHLLDYPIYRKGKNTEFKVDTSKKIVKTVDTDFWVIANSEHTVLLTLGPNYMNISLADYSRFSKAKQHYENILSAIEKVIPELEPTNLHLRFIDHIPLKGYYNAADLITPSLLGLHDFDQFKRNVSVSETGMITAEGNHLIVRCSCVASGNKLPPDLVSLPLKWKSALVSETPFIILDSIHSKELDGSHINASELLKSLEGLKENLNTLFFNVTTPKAQESWK